MLGLLWLLFFEVTRTSFGPPAFSFRIPIFDYFPRRHPAFTASIPLCIGHRGDSAHLPENTIAAFKSTLLKGGDGIELDIRLTADEQVIVMHDSSLDRTTNGSGSVRENRWVGYIDELMVRKKDCKYEYPVPLLTQVFEWLDTLDTIQPLIVIDVKDDNPAEIIPALQKVLTKTIYPHDKILIGIWNLEFLHHARSVLAATFRIGYIGRLLLPSYSDHQSLSNFSLHWGVVDADLVKALHAADRTVFTWTINTEEKIRWAHLMSVDGIITDDPLMCKVNLGYR